MKTKHTPGPWIVDGGEPDETDLVAETARHNVYGRRSMSRVVSSELAYAEDEANARLIAAAPDCLSALQLVLNDNRLMNAMSREQVRAIMDAVAKATGGAE